MNQRRYRFKKTDISFKSSHFCLCWYDNRFSLLLPIDAIARIKLFQSSISVKYFSHAIKT